MENNVNLSLIPFNEEQLEKKMKKWFKEVLVEQANPQTQQQDIVAIDEAMKITSLARQTLYGLVFDRKIPFIKRPKSRKLYFSRKALLAWIQEAEK